MSAIQRPGPEVDNGSELFFKNSSDPSDPTEKAQKKRACTAGICYSRRWLNLIVDFSNQSAMLILEQLYI
jgi:hypothetical protein